MQKSIESIENQSFKNFEVWVIDGGSTIETQDYLSTLEKPFFYQSKKDNGIYDAMNKGVDLSKGEWLFFLGAADELYNENVLESIFKINLLENEKIISGKVIYEGNSKPFVYSKDSMIKNPAWSFKMWFWNGLHHQGSFYKKELFTNIKFSLKYKTLSDYWFNLKLYQQKEKCKLTEIMISKCNSDGISKTGKWNLYKEEISLKNDVGYVIFKPFFYIVAGLKFLSRKIVNEK